MAWDGLTFSLLLVFLALVVLLLIPARSLHDRSGLPGQQVIYTAAGTWFRDKDPLHSA